MYKKFVSSFVLFAVCGILALTACSGSGNSSNSSNSSSSKLTDESLKTSPKDSIAYQFELLKQGNTAKLKECFTERQREKITAEAVEKGKTEASKNTLDDLVGSVENGEYEGKKTAKIKMKNGRTLTTLVQTDGKWLADTIWFN